MLGEAVKPSIKHQRQRARRMYKRQAALYWQKTLIEFEQNDVVPLTRRQYARRLNLLKAWELTRPMNKD